jgi:isopenicillin-N N-acyltransferase-like protein
LIPTPYFVKLTGSSEEIGYQHGNLLNDRVQAVWKFYSDIMFDNNLDFLQQYGDQYLDTIHSFFPGYGIEIEALAQAAGLEAWQIAVLNARTELLHRLVDTFKAGECTTAFLPNKRVLGQNWDWTGPLESLVVVMEIERRDGHRIIQITEPGIIGKIGLNSEGIGVCLNILSGAASKVSVPIHILLRMVLDSRSLKNVGKRIESISSVVMDLPHRTAHISVGNPNKADYHAYDLS